MSYNAELTSYLNDFINLETPPNFATMIDGDWGSGKTWFIRDLIASQPQQNKLNVLFISLYGVSSTEQIDEIIFKQLHPFLSSKGMLIAGTLTKALVKGTLKIDLNNSSFSEAELSPELSNINIKDYSSTPEKNLLIFDDLERCELGWNSIFGYINYFVEEKKCKAIIIANEKEIHKLNGEGIDCDDYTNAKEKVVGISFKYQPQHINAREFFLNKTTPNIREILHKYGKDIDELLDLSQCMNMRFIERQLFNFARFYQAALINLQNNGELILRLYQIHFILSYESHRMKQSVFTILTGKTDADLKYTSILIDKYGTTYLSNLILEYDEWIEIIDNQKINKEAIINNLDRFVTISNKTIEPWTLLWNYERLPYWKFEEVYDATLKTLMNSEILNEHILKHIYGLLLNLSRKNIKKINEDHLSEMVYRTADYLIENDLIQLDYDFDDEESKDTRWGGLSYHSQDSDEFKALVNYFDKIIDANRAYQLSQKTIKIAELIKLGDHIYYAYLNVNNREINSHHDIPFLYFADAKYFAKILINSSEMHYFGYSLQNRYKNTPYLKKLSAERFFHRDLIRELLSLDKTINSKLLSLQISELINHYLTPAIEKLAESIYEQPDIKN